MTAILKYMCNQNTVKLYHHPGWAYKCHMASLNLLFVDSSGSMNLYKYAYVLYVQQKAKHCVIVTPYNR